MYVCVHVHVCMCVFRGMLPQKNRNAVSVLSTEKTAISGGERMFCGGIIEWRTVIFVVMGLLVLFASVFLVCLCAVGGVSWRSVCSRWVFTEKGKMGPFLLETVELWPKVLSLWALSGKGDSEQWVEHLPTFSSNRAPWGLWILGRPGNSLLHTHSEESFRRHSNKRLGKGMCVWEEANKGGA